MQKKLQNPPTSKLTAGEYVAKLTEMGAAQARESFYWFRRLIRPHMLKFGRVRRAQPHTTMRRDDRLPVRRSDGGCHLRSCAAMISSGRISSTTT